MWRDLQQRMLRPLVQGPMTARHPSVAPSLPPAARGLPVVSPVRCDATGACADACPTGAISVSGGTWRLDLGRCIFCSACEDACPHDAIRLTGRIELAVTERTEAIVETRLTGGEP
jgi:hydrogenase-4 component H/formate hydrogenlyase subunit 6